MFLLDTDVVSNFTKPRPDPRVAEWSRSLSDGIALAAATVAEIERGARLLEPRDPARAAWYSAWLDQLVAAPDSHVIAFGVREARLYAAMAAEPSLLRFLDSSTLSRRGPKVGADLMIAATAIASGLPLASGNGRHMMLIHEFYALPGLYDPFAGCWLVRPAVADDIRREQLVLALA